MIEKYIKIDIVENKYDSAFLKEGFKVTPLQFNQVKEKYLRKYYKLMIEEDQPNN